MTQRYRPFTDTLYIKQLSYVIDFESSKNGYYFLYIKGTHI